MFVNSVKRRKLKYVEYVGHGDTNSFGAVVEALVENFGNEYKIEKEDCIGHVQKPMGAVLRNFKCKCNGVKLDDGKTVGGKGRLMDKRMDEIQTWICHPKQQWNRKYFSGHLGYLLSHNSWS